MLIDFLAPPSLGGRTVYINPAMVSAVNYYGMDSHGPTSQVWLNGSPYPLIVLGGVSETANRLHNAGRPL